jgi:hypothetical protein
MVIIGYILEGSLCLYPGPLGCDYYPNDSQREYQKVYIKSCHSSALPMSLPSPLPCGRMNVCPHFHDPCTDYDIIPVPDLDLATDVL